MSDGQNSFQSGSNFEKFKKLSEERIQEIFKKTNSSHAKISYLLSQLNLKLIEYDNYTKFSLEPISKLYIFKKIKGINCYYNLLNKITEEDALNLGFLKNENNKLELPPKRTFNHYLKTKLTEEQKKLLDHISESILALATQNKIVLDIEIVKKVVTEKKNEAKEQRKAIKEATKLVKKLVYPQIEIQIKENAKFTTKDLLDVLVHVAQTKDFAHNGTATYQELNPDAKHPSSWTMLRHFKKLEDNDTIKETFEKIFDVVFNFAKQNYNILKRRQLNIAIDIHKIPYYGNKNDPYVTEGKHERGTTHFYQFITCSIVVAGRRFTIDAILMHKLDAIEDLVNRLIKRAKEKINIDKVYLDRWFDKPKVINVLKANHVNFIMPKIRSATVKAWFDKSEACKSRVIKDFEIGTGENKAIVNLILVDDEEGVKRAFITNFHIPEQLTHYLFKFYSKRWGIETGYRQLDHDFKPKTTSKNHNLRLFYFLFSVCLYNLWVLVNICVSLSLYGRIKDEPVITAKLFAVILYRVAYENPPT